MEINSHPNRRAALVQAVIVLLVLLLLAAVLLHFVSLSGRESLLRLAHNVLGLLIGGQSAVVAFRVKGLFGG